MATVTEKVKESLVGTTQPPNLSQESRAEFMKHAKQDDDGDWYMTEGDFINAIAPPEEDYHKIKREQYGILFNIADRNNDGRINMVEWAMFDNLLGKPDAGYEIAFRLFDTEGTGAIDLDTFRKLYDQNRREGSIPFNWDSSWASLYFGKRKHAMTYPDFSQMMRGLQGERVRQAFEKFDVNHDGYIEPEEFEQIIRATASHKLSDHILDNLPTLCNITEGSKISYAVVRAFQNVLREMDLLDLIIRNATSKAPDGRIDRNEFTNEAARLTRVALYTPLEADILFHLASLDNPSGRLSMQDFSKVLDSSYGASSDELVNGHEKKPVTAFGNFLEGLLESAHHFALGAVAGAFGAFMVYPIDLVKTRMQNQRTSAPGSRLYENSIDCARKVVRNEGFRGLYSGVLPQLVGVAPEKAIKLTVNDLVRTTFTDKQTNFIPLWSEVLSGASAGGCQVVFTNPLEIVKIRLQVQGELAKKADVPKRSAMWIVRNLGLIGLYKGASACLLRDVPFSAIYFPTYAHLKKDFFGESREKKLGVLQLLTAGAIAGMPAAYLTTPADVIKTRLQVEARKGDQTYTGIRDCAQKIMKDEGFKAFFKGGPARILRSSPQFGFTLAAYEVLSTALPLHATSDAEAKQAATGSMIPGIGLQETKAPLPYLRSRNALKIILDLDSGFGKFKLPEQKAWQGLPSKGKALGFFGAGKGESTSASTTS